MANGWTGAQYSFLRIGLGLYLAAGLTVLLVVAPGPLVAFALSASLALAIGFKDRVAAAVVAVLVGPLQPVVGALLLVHAIAVPSAPYGSWDARGRLDPGGGWRLPWPAHMCFRAVAAGFWLWGVAVMRRGGLGPVEIADLAAVGLLVHGFAFDPAWIRGRGEGAPTLVLYDGQCGFCQAWVRLLLAEDADGRRFRFAPLQGERAHRSLGDDERRGLGDTVVALTADGTVLSRSEAAIHIGHRLGGFWRAAALLARVVPRRLRDAVYDAVARVRHHLARKPKDVCPILPAALRARFEV